MVCVNVEDCIEKINNRFELILLSGFRARQISQGALVSIDRNQDKNLVIALREIAKGILSPRLLKENFINSLQNNIEIDEPENNNSKSNLSLKDKNIEKKSGIIFEKISEKDLLSGIKKITTQDKNEDF